MLKTQPTQETAGSFSSCCEAWETKRILLIIGLIINSGGVIPIGVLSQTACLSRKQKWEDNPR